MRSQKIEVRSQKPGVTESSASDGTEGTSNQIIAFALETTQNAILTSDFSILISVFWFLYSDF